MNKIFITTLCAIALIFSTFAAQAVTAPSQKETEKHFITENLKITLRSGKGTKSKIVRMLRSGTPIELLESDKKTGYSHIKTASGTEGWVLTRFLSRHPSSKNVLKKTQEKLARIEIQYKQQEKELDNTLAQQRKTASLNQDLLKKNSSLDRELKRIKQAAASTLAIDDKNRTLQKKLINNEHTLLSLQQENQVLKSSDSRKWFLYGGSFALLCLFLGFILPKLSWKRKSSWRSF